MGLMPQKTFEDLLGTSNPDTDAYRVYKTLRRDIRNGLIPPGQRLRTEWLKETFGASTSPLREALARLNAEHYVAAEGKRGFRVTELSRKDYVSVTEMRDDLESSALRKSIANRSEEWEARVLLAHHALTKVRLDNYTELENVERREERHRLFHLELISACDSTWLLRVCDHLASHAERYNRVILKNAQLPPSYYERVDSEHRRLFELAMDGQAEPAIDLLRSHRQRSYNAVLRGLEHPGERPVIAA
mgnify:CR=1 FL=1